MLSWLQVSSTEAQVLSYFSQKYLLFFRGRRKEKKNVGLFLLFHPLI